MSRSATPLIGASGACRKLSKPGQQVKLLLDPVNLFHARPQVAVPGGVFDPLLRASEEQEPVFALLLGVKPSRVHLLSEGLRPWGREARALVLNVLLGCGDSQQGGSRACRECCCSWCSAALARQPAIRGLRTCWYPSPPDPAYGQPGSRRRAPAVSLSCRSPIVPLDSSPL